MGGEWMVTAFGAVVFRSGRVIQLVKNWGPQTDQDEGGEGERGVGNGMAGDERGWVGSGGSQLLVQLSSDLAVLYNF